MGRIVGICIGLLAFAATAYAEEPTTAEPLPAASKPTLDEPAIKGPRGWIVDGTAGAPVLKSGALKVVASGMLGYRWKKLEVIAYGNLNQTASKSDNVFNNTTRVGWQLNGAYVMGEPGDKVRWLIVQDFTQTFYFTRYTELSTSSSGALRDFNVNIKSETSDMLRGTTFVGALLTPSPRTKARVTVGGGLQAELYVMAQFRNDMMGTEAAFDIDLQVSLRQQLQILARHEIAPRKVSVRLYSDSSTFKLSRSSAAVRIDFDKFSESEATASLFTYRQIDSTNRVAVDLDWLAWRGLRPSVFSGLDITLLRGDIGKSNAFVPVFGVGLTNGQF